MAFRVKLLLKPSGLYVSGIWYHDIAVTEICFSQEILPVNSDIL